MTETAATTDILHDAGSLTLTLAHRAEVAQGIHLFDLRDPSGHNLPPFEPGAHVLLRTPSGVARRYSLCNDPRERDRYVVAVKRDENGGGGSISMADALAIGDTVQLAPPENYFPLSPGADRHLLIAGGIGITPILAMARALAAEGREFRVVYCARSPEVAAFVDVLHEEFGARVTIHYDGGAAGRVMDFAGLLKTRGTGEHVYCCGPRPLMHAVREAARHWPSAAVHFEDFGTSAQPDAQSEHEFTIRLQRSGKVLPVPAGVSILDVLRRAGMDVPASCEAGTCGSCRMGLLGGTADHRDFVLDDDEQDSAIMICVSRAISKELTLDV